MTLNLGALGVGQTPHLLLRQSSQEFVDKSALDRYQPSITGEDYQARGIDIMTSFPRPTSSRNLVPNLSIITLQA